MRQAAQAALDALETVEPYVEQLVDYSSTAAEWPLNSAPRKMAVAIEALRAALAAEPAQPADSESVRAAQDDAYVCGRNEERARCAKLCLRPAGWLSDSHQALADEIRSAILGTSA